MTELLLLKKALVQTKIQYGANSELFLTSWHPCLALSCLSWCSKKSWTKCSLSISES